MQGSNGDSGVEGDRKGESARFVDWGRDTNGQGVKESASAVGLGGNGGGGRESL